MLDQLSWIHLDPDSLIRWSLYYNPPSRLIHLDPDSLIRWSHYFSLAEST